MSSLFKVQTTSLLALGSSVAAIALIAGCGGGGGGGGSNNSGTPSPYDATYQVTYVPSDVVPSDGKAPTGTLTVIRGRATNQFTFYLQDSVVTRVQKAVDDGLTKAGYASEIRNNQVPATIDFNVASNLSANADGSGKLTLVSTKSVNVCGSAKLTVNANVLTTGTTQGTYTLDFPTKLTIKVRGTNQSVTGTCNNLPNRTGQGFYVKPDPTPTPTTVATTPPA